VARHSKEGSSKTQPVTPTGKTLRFLREVAIVVVAALVLSFLLKTFLIQSFTIPSGSMNPVLERGDRVIVTKLAPGMLKIHRGDIVVFTDPGQWVQDQPVHPQRTGLARVVRAITTEIGLTPVDGTEYLIKRVIGLSGDRVACAGPGKPLTVNGVAIDETLYLPAGAAPSGTAFDVVVPDGALWVMGDNRAASSDSRAHMDEELGGAVAKSRVVGVAQLRSWPIGRWSVLRNPGQVFAEVPNAEDRSAP